MRHLMLVEVVTTSKVGGRIAFLKHLMERCHQMTCTTEVFVGTRCQTVERFRVADVPVGRLTKTVGEVIQTSSTMLIVGIQGLVERVVVVLDMVVGRLADLVLHMPSGEGD